MSSHKKIKKVVEKSQKLNLSDSSSDDSSRDLSANMDKSTKIILDYAADDDLDVDNRDFDDFNGLCGIDDRDEMMTQEQVEKVNALLENILSHISAEKMAEYNSLVRDFLESKKNRPNLYEILL